jgi:hypothetical protein
MSEDFRGLYDVRDGKAEDLSFILATFLRGLYYGDSWFSLIPKAVFMANYKPVIEALLRKNVVKVACLKEDPDVILGYSILSPDLSTIHWVQVKSIWRRKGIAKSLVPQYPIQVTHLTKLGLSLLPKFQDCQFNPFAL